MPVDTKVLAAPDVPFFTPLQKPPAGTGTAVVTQEGEELPLLFQPIKIRGVLFQNRIWVSPLCQYSAQDGFVTPWHMAHLGGMILRGAGHTMIEATAITANGRITPQDTGIWSDDHIAPLAQLVDFAHSQSQKIGIQLAHAGRKASTVPPWITGNPTATSDVGGWPEDVWAPSDIAYEDTYPKPKALSPAAVKTIVREFREGAVRAVTAGFDVIEIHAAHGYLLDSFLSPASNKREDEYGGSWENRTRIVIEIVDEIRKVIPKEMPLFLRISGTDWLEESLPNEPSWRSEDTARLAPILYKHGVDFYDVSSGGNHPKQKIRAGPGYQAFLAKDTLRHLGVSSAYDEAITDDSGKPPRLIVGSVGAITSGKQAEKLLQDGDCDVIIVGRQFLKNPFTVWAWAEEIGGVTVQLPNQIRWAFKGRGHKTSDGKEDYAKGSENKKCKV